MNSSDIRLLTSDVNFRSGPRDANPRFTLGVNYWPRRKAMYWWSAFDPAEVREDFELICSLGLTLVRIFLLWDDFQPEAGSVNPAALDNLGTVADTAAEFGLSLNVTFFTGHMSGPAWAPGWLLDRRRRKPVGIWQVVSGGCVVNCGYRNPFTDPIALWNLGNEPDLFAWPPSAAVGQAWVRRMTAVIRSLDPVHPVTCGLHVNSLIINNGLRVHDVFAETDVAVMHGYPMYAPWAGGPLDTDFVPFVCALNTALCARPTLMEEFGGCTLPPGQRSTTWRWLAYGLPRWQFMASEKALAEYLERVLPGLAAVGATGAVLWCFADYAPELWKRPPCEHSRHVRFFGLVRPDGSLKPHAEVLRCFAAARPIVQPAARRVELDVAPDQYYRAPLMHARRLYRRFRAG